jgi:hypothetical protein
MVQNRVLYEFTAVYGWLSFEPNFGAGFTTETDNWQGFDVSCMLLLVLQHEELSSSAVGCFTMNEVTKLCLYILWTAELTLSDNLLARGPPFNHT